MAKKKKSNQENISTQINSLAYQGKVTFQVMRGNKIINTKKYLNSGLPDLFRYIGHALAGTVYSALRPCKIALFNCNTGGVLDPANFNWDTAQNRGLLTPISPYVVYDATPVVLSTATGYSTTFRFKVPFNWLYSKDFNVLGLFTENNTACAYYLFTKDDGTGKKVWDTPGEELDDITTNYSLVIEWTMEISNK